MLRQSLSLVKSLVLGTSLSLALVGCAGDPDASGPTDQNAQVQNELVSARDIAELPAGERLQLDLADNVVYFFEYAQPIDYARVEIAAGDLTFSLEDHVLALQSADYGTNPPIDVTESPNNQFRIAFDPADFGDELNADELAVLKETGYFYKDISGPGITPQTTGENCTTGVCETCGPPPGASFCDWSPANPCVCTYEIHQWCD